MATDGNRHWRSCFPLFHSRFRIALRDVEDVQLNILDIDLYLIDLSFSRDQQITKGVTLFSAKNATRSRRAPASGSSHRCSIEQRTRDRMLRISSKKEISNKTRVNERISSVAASVFHEIQRDRFQIVLKTSRDRGYRD